MLEGVTSEEVKLARARMDRIRKKIEKMLEELEKAPANEDGSKKTITVQVVKAPSDDEYEHLIALKVHAALQQRKHAEKEPHKNRRTE